MKSPLHPQRSLEKIEIEPGLHAWKCPVSHGLWISLASYTRWQQSMAVDVPANAEVPEVMSDADKPAMFCPESGVILQRFRVGKGAAFHIERSPVTGGIWLDQGEWEAVKALGLHNEIHVIFTASYQSRLRREASEAMLDQVFGEKVGTENFTKLKEISDWLNASGHGREMLNYLINQVGRGS